MTRHIFLSLTNLIHIRFDHFLLLNPISQCQLEIPRSHFDLNRRPIVQLAQNSHLFVIAILLPFKKFILFFATSFPS